MSLYVRDWGDDVPTRMAAWRSMAVLALSLLLGIGASSQPAGAYMFVGCKWKKAGYSPVLINYSLVEPLDGLNSEYRAIEQHGISIWNEAVEGVARFYEQASSYDFNIDSTYLGQDASDGVFYYSDACFTDGAYRRGARLRLNQSKLDGYVLTKPNIVLGIFNHELGHAFGLDHENRFGSTGVIMASPLNAAKRYTPNLDDISGVKALYPFRAPSGGGGGGGDLPYLDGILP
jgi:hypothetical protein